MVSTSGSGASAKLQDAGASLNLPYDLNCTLGYPNVAFSYASTATPTAWHANTIASGAYLGDPTYPFPWIAWNNRPYANAMELLMVPSCHPGRLLWEYQPVPKGTNPARPPSLHFSVASGREVQPHRHN